jgi:tetratricopeptide (TPR) repeat protein
MSSFLEAGSTGRSRRSRRAQSGGVNISGHVGSVGGDIVGRDKIGVDEKEVGRQIAEAQRPVTEQLIEHRATLARLTEQMAREKGVEIKPLRAILGKLGEAGVPDDEIPARLDAAANQLISLRTQLARLTNERPEFASIRNQALAYIDRGEFDAARAALARGRDAARPLREKGRALYETGSRNEAEFLADEAGIDHLNLAYRAAADKYAEAASLVGSFDRDAQQKYLLQQAGALGDQGREFGDNEALLEAIDLYRLALTFAPRERAPLQWALMQTNLSNALFTLGERESGTARLEQAVAAYDEALKESTRDRVPRDWATMQHNRGVALAMLGERESGTARLEQAVAAFNACLRVATSIWPPDKVSQVHARKDEAWAEIKRRMTKWRLAPLLVRLWRQHRD